MRGNRSTRSPVRTTDGSIPACAGEPKRPWSSTWARWVYPRVCGGTQAVLPESAGGGGLSPRVRGNPRLGFQSTLVVRSIPACAGEPTTRPPRWGVWRVYPRVCGGTSVILTPSAEVPGLSPRVRGNPPHCRPPYCQRGSIPACAGEPILQRLKRPPPVVYPRVCGGTRVSCVRSAEARGLSPRVRGNLLDGICLEGDERSIPACAGEPGRAPFASLNAQVYPRVCGGTALTPGGFLLPCGLSPRVRGNRRRIALPPGDSRSIPACAGEPGTSVDVLRQAPVYPRVCGGTGPG